ncbi:MAG: hypothetical protein V4596_01530 [Bdellovibrionota bacterium]
MKALRVYFSMALVWVTVGLTLVACSDKEKNGAPAACQGQVVNGICTWDPSNPGSGGGVYNPNGNITDESKFRDFNLRIFVQDSYSLCVWSYPYGCRDIQAKVQKINDTEYYVYLTSTSLGYRQTIGQVAQTVRLNGTKFTYDGSNQVIFEVYYNNPTRYIIAELVLHQGLSGNSTYYTLNFKDNSSWKTIANGTMDKGYDY